MIRVMQINAGEAFGGVSAMVYQIYQHIDHNKIQFDFVAPNVTSYYPYRDEIEAAGGRIYELHADGMLLLRKLRYFVRLYRHLRKQRYRIVHINSGSVMFNLQTAAIARLAGVKRILVHSHNAGNEGARMKRLTPLLRKMITWFSTDYLACSHKSAEYMFDRRVINEHQYHLILNGIDVEEHKFSQNSRDKIRAEYGLEDKRVLLHVGRFNVQKNHSRLIQIFQAYLKKHPDSVLLLIGEGELYDRIHEMVTRDHMENNVMFLGLRKDVADFMSAADVFVLPSLYEGLPVVGIEAQCSGLPCVFSAEITRETDITGKNCFVPLEKDDKVWTAAIDAAMQNRIDRNCAREYVETAEYTIQATARKMEHLYLKRI